MRARRQATQSSTTACAGGAPPPHQNTSFAICTLPASSRLSGTNANKKRRVACDASPARAQRRSLREHAHSGGHPRAGITLYEVLLSIAIFFVAMAGISQLISIGADAAIHAKLQSEAAMHCESKLNEVVAGAIDMEAVDGQSLLEDDPAWQWSLTVVNDAPEDKMISLTVTVAHFNNGGTPNALYTLTRYVRDPQVFLDAAAEEEEKSAAAAEEEAGLESTSSN